MHRPSNRLISTRGLWPRRKAQAPPPTVVDAVPVPEVIVGEPVVFPDDGCGMGLTITPIYTSGPASIREEQLRQYVAGLGCHDHDDGDVAHGWPE